MASLLAQRRQLEISKVQSQQARPEAVPARSIRLMSPTETIEDFYELGDTIYEDTAGNGKVYHAICRSTGVHVVVKLRRHKGGAKGENMWRKLLSRIMNLDPHSHVLGIRDVLEDDDYTYVVMERCSGGELFSFLREATDVPEKECKRIMREILSAVDHIHQQGLLHRDIKPENIMFKDNRTASSPTDFSSPGSLKLIDFDTCQSMDPTAEGSTAATNHVVGTMGYIAPEALKGEYSVASDLWSVGVILYILMTGEFPFDEDLYYGQVEDTRCGSESMIAIYQKLKDAKIDFECEPWSSFPQARDLCHKLLAFDPEARSPTAQAALDHPWLKD